MVRKLRFAKDFRGSRRAAPHAWPIVLLVPLLLGSVWAAESGLTAVRSLIHQGKFREAQQKLETVLVRNPHDAAALILLGEVKKNEHQYKRAEELFKQAVQISPALASAHEQLASLYADEERIGDAIAANEEVRKLQPRNIKARVRLATLLEQDGKHEKSLEAAMAVAPATRPLSLLPVMVADYLALNQPDDAQKLVGEILRHAPSHPELVPQLAALFLRQGMAGDANDLLRIAEKHQKMTAPFLAALAHVQSLTGSPDQGKETLASALALDPNDYEALSEKARQEGKAGDWRGAIESLQKILKTGPPRASVLQHLVFAAMQADDLQTAHDAAVDLYDFDPDSPENGLALAVVLVRASHWGEAKPVLEKVLLSRPEEKRAKLALGIAEYNLGGIDRAMELLTASLGQGAADGEAHYMLGLVAKQRGDIPTAAHEMEMALAATPDKPEALSSLGQFYLQLNEVEKARSVLEKAVAKLPNDAQNHYQLGLAYRKLNLMEPARVQMGIFQNLSARQVPHPTGELPSTPR